MAFRLIGSFDRLVTSLAKVDERWGEGEQQDAQEFLHSFLEMLQADLSPGASSPLGPRRSSLSLSESQQVTKNFCRKFASWQDDASRDNCLYD